MIFTLFNDEKLLLSTQNTKVDLCDQELYKIVHRDGP